MGQLHWSIFFADIEPYGSAVLFLASTAVLSRLLTPSEFGINAAIVALTVALEISGILLRRQFLPSTGPGAMTPNSTR